MEPRTTESLVCIVCIRLRGFLFLCILGGYRHLYAVAGPGARLAVLSAAYWSAFAA